MTASTTALRLLTALAVVSTLLLSACGGPLDISGKTSRELMNSGMDYYARGKYLRSIECFQGLVYNYPGESLIDSAQYFLALSYFGQEDYVLGAVEFNRLLVNYPQSPFAPQAQLMKAVCTFEGTPDNPGLDQTDLEPAIEQFEDFLIDYPESEAVADARQYLNTARTRLATKYYNSGIVYTRLRDYRAARIYFQKVIDDFTETEYAALATYQLAECHYRQRQWDEAHEAFENFRRVFDSHELATQAAERSCESALKGGKEAYDAGEYALARTRFERVVAVCGEESLLNKASEYLQKIGETPVTEAQAADGGS